jgi:hypothetical protein
LRDEALLAYYHVDPLLNLEETQSCYPSVYQFYSDDPYTDYLLNISVKNAIAKHGANAEASILSELAQLHGTTNFRPTWKGVHFKDLTPEQRSGIIRSFMFLKEKYLPNGSFDKLKSRLVGGGNDQQKSLFEDSSITSPTISTTSAFLLANIAASEKRFVATIDVPGAYLNSELPQPVFMKLDRIMTDYLIRLDPAFQQYRRTDGSSIVRLTRALYGLVQSARLWYENVKNKLLINGFIQNPHDMCVFNKHYRGSQITVGVHVDDFIITCKDYAGLIHVKDILTKHYGKIQFKTGKIISYLGMEMDFTNSGKVKISQHGCINDLLNSYHVTGSATTPALPDLFIIDSSAELLSKQPKESFHSIVATLLYIAKRSRPDLLLAVSFLTTRVQKSTVQDQHKLDRLLRYLNGTRHLSLHLSSNSLTVVLYADAAFGIHHDCKSHTGTIISLGNGALFAKSARQSLVTKSSTESELVGLSDSLSQAIWIRHFMIAQGYDTIPPVIAYQDNLSTIALASKEQSTSTRTRHIAIRFFWIKDLQDRKEISVKHLSTHDMIADLLTKPLQGLHFLRLRDLILGSVHF